MTLTASEVASLTATMGLWELAEYVSAGLVTLGCIGEFVAEFTKWFTGGIEETKERLAKYSTLLLIFALSAELVCLVRTNQLSGMVIASLNEKAEDANARARSFEAKAQESNQKAEEAKTLAKGFESRLADANARVKRAEAQIASAKARTEEAVAKIATAEARIKEAEEKAEAERLARVKIQDDLKWRTVTEEQTAKLLAALPPEYTGVRVTMSNIAGDAEAAQYAAELREVLLKAGWVIDGINASLVTGILPEGVSISIGDANNRSAATLQQALLAAGIRAEGTIVPGMRAEAIDLLVGAKPHPRSTKTKQ